MISKQEEIARPYAKAAFEFASEHQQIKQWASMLQMLATLTLDPQVGHALRSPELSLQQQEQLFFSLVGDLLDEPAKNLVRLLIANKRLRMLPEISHQFHLLQEAAINVLEAEVVSARVISDTQLAQLKQALEQRTKATIELQHRVDPSILGGLYVRIGDEVIDDSIAGKLKRLARHLQLEESVCP